MDSTVDLYDGGVGGLRGSSCGLPLAAQSQRVSGMESVLDAGHLVRGTSTRIQAWALIVKYQARSKAGSS